MPGALRYDAQALLAGEAHDGGDVVGRARLGDERRALVDVQASRRATQSIVVATSSPGNVEVAGELLEEGVERDGGASGGDRGEILRGRGGELTVILDSPAGGRVEGSPS